MRALVALVVALALMLPVAAGAADPIQADSTVQQYFRLQWQAEASKIAGYVENVSDLPFHRMRLLVERLDAGGAVIGSTTTWVMGIVVPRHRSYFSTRVPPAPSYRVTVLAFDWSNCRD